MCNFSPGLCNKWSPKILWNNRSISVHLSPSLPILFWSILVHLSCYGSVSVCSNLFWSVSVCLRPSQSVSVRFGPHRSVLVRFGPIWSVSVRMALMYPHTRFNVNTSSSLGVLSQNPKLGGSAPPYFGSPAPVFLWTLLKPRLSHSEVCPLSTHVGFIYGNIAQTEYFVKNTISGGGGFASPKPPSGKFKLSLC